LTHPTLRGNVYKALLRGNFISASGSGVLVKRSVFDNVGLFDESLRACEDWDMWLRIALQYQFDFVDAVLASIRVHQNNMQKDLIRMLSAELMVLNKFIERGEENAFLLWKIRTYLFNKGLKANTIPGFDKCTPILQAQLAGWRMDLASILLTPFRAFANLYLKVRNKA
jgi:GT2 family glycosyltransferase